MVVWPKAAELVTTKSSTPRGFMAGNTPLKAKTSVALFWCFQSGVVVPETNYFVALSQVKVCTVPPGSVSVIVQVSAPSSQAVN